ncbi:conserved Plasmodium protein, unknown function [Plasmodium ovale]|uniref:Uncharacterized protein n=1 Tax=Plasmodium ovale TaxID=36330 RepID=A0A1D3TLY8_PLAOA|nr:conserved Plasmodium protein, unknown function [Plasmodium ovale]
MYTLDFTSEEDYMHRVGDICHDFYVPSSLPGRYKCNVEDMENILYKWMNKIKKGEQKMGKKWDVKKGRREKKSEKLGKRSGKKIEDDDEKGRGQREKGGEEDGEKDGKKDGEKNGEKNGKKNGKKDGEKDGEGWKNNPFYQFSRLFRKTYFSLILSKSRYEQDVCVWEMLWCAWKHILKGSFQKRFTKYTQQFKKNITDFRAGCIYLLFFLFFSQQVVYSECTYPVYFSPEMFNMCLDVTEECEKLHVHTELRFILNFMLDSNCIILSYVDDLSEIYQDRYGAPLPTEKGKMDVENMAGICDVDMHDLYEHVREDIRDMCNTCDKYRRKTTRSKTSSCNLRSHMGRLQKALAKGDFGASVRGKQRKVYPSEEWKDEAWQEEAWQGEAWQSEWWQNGWWEKEQLQNGQLQNGQLQNEEQPNDEWPSKEWLDGGWLNGL